MKTIRKLGPIIILLMFGSMMTATTAHAQSSENYHMPWYSADSSGGGFSTGNGIKLYSNVGQSIVGNSSSSNYKLTSGYGAFFRRDTRPLVMIIASLDNDLGQYWEQVINSAEKALDGGQHVRILIDGPGDGNSYVYDLSPDSNNFCPSIRWNLLCGRYEEGINRWTWTEDVSHPVSLYRFMTEAMDAYPHADSVTLSLIGHGSGWGTDVLPGQPRRWRGQPRRWRGQADPWPDRPDNPSTSDRSNGFLWDDFTGEGQGSTASSISDLRLILEGVLEHTGRKIDLLYFDACSMGMAEVAYELRDTVRYLLVSESTAWATFAYDQMIGAIKRGMDGQEIGEAWLKVETDLLTSRSGYPFVLGLYDQSKLQDLAAAMQKLSQSLGTVSTAQRDLIIEAVTATERVESNYNGTVDIEDSYVDLKHFVEQISAKFSSNGAVKGDAEAVKEAINQTVVRKESKSGSLIAIPNETRNFDNAGGISFYFPSHQDERKREFYYNEHHLQWTNATGWGGFLDGWHGTAIRAARSSQTPEMPTCNSAEDCEGLAKPLPGPIPLPSPNTVCISSTSGGEIQGLPFRDEDILCHSPITDEWTLVFDGSKQKLPKNADVNAFHILDDGSILISFDRPFTIAGLGKIDDSDIVLYIPPANGNGRGTWKRFFTGKNAQLTKGSEDIDGLFQTADGRIVVTFIGTAKVTGVSKAKHPDMLVFTPKEPGNMTKGTWKRYFVGKTEKLTTKNENLWGISLDPDPETDYLYMVTRGNFNANGITGKSSDILQCIPTAQGNTPKCIYHLFWEGAAHGVGKENLDGVQIMLPPENPEVRIASTLGMETAPSSPSLVAIESPDEPSIMPGMTKTLVYRVENLTDNERTYAVRLDETAGWSIGSLPSTLTIPAGSEAALSVEVIHRGEAIESELTLTVTDQSMPDVEAVDIIELGEPEFDEVVFLPLIMR